MKNNFKNSPLHKRRDKDTHFWAQEKRVFEAFKGTPSTMLMVSVKTGILRGNICRFIAKWKRQNKIWKVRTGVCPISKNPKVGFYTTDPDKVPNNVNRDYSNSSISILKK